MQELKDLSIHELVEKIELLRKENFTLRLKSASEHVKNYAQFKKLRKDIARALTFLTQKQKNAQG